MASEDIVSGQIDYGSPGAAPAALAGSSYAVYSSTPTGVSVHG